MDRKLAFQTTLELMDCAKCGMHFGVAEGFIERRRRDGETFFCPAGHSQSFKESEVSRLRKKLDEQVREATEQAEHARSAERAREAEHRARLKVERAARALRRRIGAGVCPCCNRTFKQLARHMETKHPEAVPTPAAA